MPQVALFYLASALWPRNFQLFADGPNRPFFDFAMARDAGDLVQGGVEPNAMGTTFAIQNATLVAQMAFQFREFHTSAISKTSRTACGEKTLFSKLPLALQRQL